MSNNVNDKKLIKLFLKLNPRGSVGEFARCKGQIQKQLDLLRLMDSAEWEAL